jgi:hypothetical protein
VSVIAVAFLLLRYQTQVGPTALVSTPGPQPTHTVTYVQVTGLSQYQPAQAAAQVWAEDAQLAGANATWPKILTKEQIGEPTTWTYRFYSPAKKRLFFVTVEPDGRTEAIEHAIEVTLPPRPLATDGWATDSSAALAIWLDYGGEKMLRNNPGLELLIQLRSVSNNPNPVWMVVGLNNQTQQTHAVLIDANQGIVTTTSPGS